MGSGFLQTDPVPGGSANSYDYVSQDPVNEQDLDGRMEALSFEAGAGISVGAFEMIAYECSKHNGSWNGWHITFSTHSAQLRGLGDFVVHMGRKGRRLLKKFKQEQEHTSNKRPSTEEQHQRGQRRKNKDKGGEKGDRRRYY